MNIPPLPSWLLRILDALHIRVLLRTTVFGFLDFCFRIRIPFFRWRIARLESRKRQEIKSTGRKIRITFVCLDKSQWIFQSVYDAFAVNEKFETSVLTCPTWIRNNDARAKSELTEFFEAKGIPTSRRIDPLNLPDMMFVPRFDAPAFSGIFSLESLYTKVLFCGSIYGWITGDFDKAYFGKLEEAFLWKYFVFNERDRRVCQGFSVIPERDIVISGFPRNDEFLNANADAFRWKNSGHTKIIWAPHWTVLTHSQYGNFDRYAYPLLDWLKNHPDVEIVLKPHPLLRARLTDPATKRKFRNDCPDYQDPETFQTADEFDSFLSEWDTLPNGQVMNSGDYAALFASSDAMFLDSGSFLAEYMFFDKPMCFCNRSRTHQELMNVYNEFGQALFTGIQIADNLKEVTAFLENVASGHDPLKANRQSVKAKYLTVNAGQVGKTIADFVSEKFIGK